MRKVIIFLISITSICKLYSADNLFSQIGEEQQIAINNQILAKVNGKAISVYDVMKKMDMLFYRSYPEYSSVAPARYQFYQMNWKSVLNDLIDKELIIADAEENKMQVSSGDVRQEMEVLFGPNIIANLDRAGLTFEEAWKIVHDDIVVKRMMYVRTTSKVLKQVTPQDVHAAYENYSKENIRPDLWTYQVLSIRDKDKSKGLEAAAHAHQLLITDHLPLDQALEKLKDSKDAANITLSPEYTHNQNEMSDLFKSSICSLTPGSYSQPVAQKSRADNSNVFRIFYLKEFKSGGVPLFNEVAKKLKEQLLEIAAEKQTIEYLRKLRKHFDVQESILNEAAGEEFEPFKIT